MVPAAPVPHVCTRYQPTSWLDQLIRRLAALARRAPVAVQLAESATATAELAESFRGAPVDLTETLRPDGTVPIKIISPGWGSKGYYSAEMLERDGPGAFPAGTHMYLDHPTGTEQIERPERSVRDLAAVLDTPARWDTTNANGPGLYAEARIFEPYRPVINDLAPHIGISIRAAGVAHPGEAEGRKGPIIDSITEGRSVDFVTKAGRGGQVLALMESAGIPVDVDESASLCVWLESRIHADFTCRADDMYGCGQLTRDERIALSSGIGAALDAFTSAVMDKAPQLYDRSRWDELPDPGDVSTEPMEESVMPMSDKEKADLFEAFRSQLTTEIDEAVATATAATQTALDEAQAENTALKSALLIGEAQRKATDQVNAVLDLPAATRTLIAETVAAKPPVADDGTLDEAALTEAVTAEVDRQVRYLAEAGVKVGGGTVTGLGAPAATAGKTAELDEAALIASFQALGLSKAEAKHAATR